jgi:hypothetical protein
MRYFTGFLIVLCSVIFWLLPISGSIYAFKTEPRTDSFLITTATAAVHTANSTLLKPVYDNDTSTISFSSNYTTETITFTSYNTTSNNVRYAGLAGGHTRLVKITYDTTAFDIDGPYETLTDAAVWFLYIFFIIFPMGGIYVAFKPDLENIFG